MRRIVVWVLLAGWMLGDMAMAQSSALINEALDKPFAIERKDVLLTEMIQIIQNDTGVRIEADRAVWDLLPYGRQTTLLTFKIENQTLREALEGLTRQLGLQFELKDEAIELQPMPAMRRLGRRGTLTEVQALATLAVTPFKAPADKPTVRSVVEAIDLQLAEMKAPFAVEFRAEAVGADEPITLARNATMLEALEALHRDSAATWYPWGKSLIVLSKEGLVRKALDRRITTRYNGVDVAQVLTELSRDSGVPFSIEPGAIQRVPAEYRNIVLIIDNYTIAQVLESIGGVTGLKYQVRSGDVQITSSSTSAVPARDPLVGLVNIPDLGMDVVVTQSQVSEELRQYIKFKTQQELDKYKALMQEENFKPATTRPAAVNEDL